MSITALEENGIIESTTLGMGHRGCFTWWLHLTFDGSGQGFGGYVLDEYDKPKGRRVGSAWGLDSIMQLMLALGVENWEDLPDTHVRVKRDKPMGSIVAIGHIIKDQWYSPKEHAKELKDGNADA